MDKIGLYISIKGKNLKLIFMLEGRINLLIPLRLKGIRSKKRIKCIFRGEDLERSSSRDRWRDRDSSNNKVKCKSE